MKKNKIVIAVCLLIAVFIISMVVAKSPVDRQCNDGIDNDRDGDIDMADSGCSTIFDNDERVGDADCSSNPKTVQRCCQSWADKNGIVIPMCIGKWVVSDGQCGWSCDSQII